MIYLHASHGHKLLEISQAQGEPAIPTDASDDNGGFELALSEQCRAAGLHHVTLPVPIPQHFRFTARARHPASTGRDQTDDADKDSGVRDPEPPIVEQPIIRW